MLNCIPIFGKQFNINEISKYTNREIKSSKFYIIYYSASWCQGCAKFQPLFNQFLKDNPDIELIYVSIDINRNSFKRYIKENHINLYVKFDYIKKSGIMDFGGLYIPWIVMFNNKGEEVYNNIGNKLSLSKIKKIVND